MPTINFPYYIQNRLSVPTCIVDSGTFIDCMYSLCQQYPAISHYIFHDKKTQTLVNSTAFYLNGVDIRTIDPNQIITEKDVIDIEPAIVGG